MLLAGGLLALIRQGGLEPVPSPTGGLASVP
jgi:hypothetical protein